MNKLVQKPYIATRRSGFDANEYKYVEAVVISNGIKRHVFNCYSCFGSTEKIQSISTDEIHQIPIRPVTQMNHLIFVALFFLNFAIR